MHRTALWTLWLVVLLAFIGSSMPYPLMAPLFLSPEHAPIIQAWPDAWRPTLLGLTLAAFPLGQFFGAPILGALSDAYGRRKVLLWSLGCAAITHALTAWSLDIASLPMLIFSRCLTGFCEGNIAVARTMIVDLQVDKATGFGGIIAMSEIGYIMGPAISGLLVAQHSWQWPYGQAHGMSLPFYLATLLTGIVLLIVLCCLDETHQGHGQFSTRVLQAFNMHARVKRLTRLAPLGRIFLTGMLYTMAGDFFYTFTPAFMTLVRGMAPQGIAWCNAWFSISSAAAALLASRLFRVWGHRRVGVISCTGMGLCLVAGILPWSLPLYIACLCITTVFIALAGTFFSVRASDVAPENHQGEVLGTQQGLHTLGDALVALIGGVMLVHHASTPLLVGAGIIVITSYLLWRRPV